MKKFKSAFTLAELLLCIGIIGIVSAMGMVITKHSTDRAYQLYYYTGYINLYNAIADAKASDKATVPDIMNHVQTLLSKEDLVANSLDGIDVASDYYHFDLLRIAASSQTQPQGNLGYDSNSNKNDAVHEGPNRYTMQDGVEPKLADDAGGIGGPGYKTGSETGSETESDPKVNPKVDPKVNPKVDPKNEGYTNYEFTTRNGIRYGYSLPNSGADDLSILSINMSVPVAKTRTNNGMARTTFIFSNSGNGYLIPMPPEDGSTSPNLQERRDLLPFYIDDGKVGRNNVVNRNQGFRSEKPIYGSFKDAFCSLHPEYNLVNDGRTVINCVARSYTDIRPVENGTRKSGILKIANPQKIH